MNVHVSIDDVVLSLKELCVNKPKSVFELPFFQHLKEFNEKYGVKFSLYTFVRYEEFLISQVSESYWNELLDSSQWLRFGFHGVRTKGDSEKFTHFCDLFYNTVPREIQTSVLRLHRYSCTYEEIKILQEYGLSELLCRDDESKRRLQALPSYNLSDGEFQSLSNNIINKDGIVYRKTNMQLELYDESLIEEYLKEQIEKTRNDDVLVLFTHEIRIPEKKKLMEKVFEILQTRQVEYIL